MFRSPRATARSRRAGATATRTRTSFTRTTRTPLRPKTSPRSSRSLINSWREAYLGDPAGNLLCLYGGEQPSISTLEGDVMSNEWPLQRAGAVRLWQTSTDPASIFYVKQLEGSAIHGVMRKRGKGSGRSGRAAGLKALMASPLAMARQGRQGPHVHLARCRSAKCLARGAGRTGRGRERWALGGLSRLMVIVDPDRNELYFPYPSDVNQT